MAGNTRCALITNTLHISHKNPTFRKKNGRSSWCVEDMKKAMESVLAAKMCVRKAAARFNSPKSSIQDRIPN